MDDKASFDLVRASVNVVLSGLLIALGTSLKLPLSTTYVAFMVAMGLRWQTVLGGVRAPYIASQAYCP